MKITHTLFLLSLISLLLHPIKTDSVLTNENQPKNKNTLIQGEIIELNKIYENSIDFKDLKSYIYYYELKLTKEALQNAEDENLILDLKSLSKNPLLNNNNLF